MRWRKIGRRLCFGLILVAILVMSILNYVKKPQETGEAGSEREPQNKSIAVCQALSTENVEDIFRLEAMDGYTLKEDDLFILKDQKEPLENGAYIKSRIGTDPFIKYDDEDITFFFVEEGKENKNKLVIIRSVSEPDYFEDEGEFKGGRNVLVNTVNNDIPVPPREIDKNKVPLYTEEGWKYVDFVLHKLADVEVNTRQNSEILAYDGGRWVNRVLKDPDELTPGMIRNDTFLPAEVNRVYLVDLDVAEARADLPPITEDNDNHIVHFIKVDDFGTLTVYPAGVDTISNLPSLPIVDNKDTLNLRANFGTGTWVVH